MRRLTEQQTLSALRRGAAVEQMLNESLADREPIRWVSASAVDGRFALRLHQVRDEGTVEFLDVSAFTPIDEEEQYGEGRLVGEYADAEALLAAAAVIGGRSDHWVNAGVIQDEYADLRRATHR